jgi:hypothetical protein
MCDDNVILSQKHNRLSVNKKNNRDLCEWKLDQIILMKTYTTVDFMKKRPWKESINSHRLRHTHTHTHMHARTNTHAILELSIIVNTNDTFSRSVRCKSVWSDTNGGRDYLKACPCGRERREFVGVASHRNPFYFL